MTGKFEVNDLNYFLEELEIIYYNYQRMPIPISF